MVGRVHTASHPRRPGSLTADTDPRPRAILLVFLDGVGLGEDDPTRNPLAAADLPTMTAIAGGHRPVLGMHAGPGIPWSGLRSSCRPIDVTLGVPGLPQSGTGQVALLAGVNAPALLGRHFGPWVPTALRDLLASRSLFGAASSHGLSVAFANAYPSGHMLPGGRGVRRPGAFPFAAHAADLLRLDEADLRAGRAVVSSITTETWRRFVDPSAPVVTPAEAGANLAAIANRHDLTVFAHFDTDHVGHRGGLREGVAAIERVDRFLDSLIGHLDRDVLLVVTSDHGNLEDVAGGHTLNPVPLMLLGPAHALVAGRVERISDVSKILLDLMIAGEATL